MMKFYWRLLLRRLPAMSLLFLVCTVLGIILALRLPTVYQTSARLLVEAPQISENLAASTVQVAATEEIEIIRQQLMTRANLLDIANDLNVFAPGENRTPDDTITAMREATWIEASGGGDSRRGPAQPTLVNVTFSARSGAIAAAVVNEYVTRITAANVRNRTGAAEDTLDFFQQEVERLSAELDLRSSRISQFQRDNSGALPDGQDYRLNRQALLQERRTGLEREIDALDEQLDRLTQLFEATGSIGTTANRNLPPEQQRVVTLEAELAQALTVYSSTNPRVVQLEAQLAQARAAASAAGGQESEGENTQTALYNLQVNDLTTRIEQLSQQIPNIDQELDRLQVAIEQTPLNTITLESLQRDYENIRQQYDTAVARLSQASVGERIELTARGQRITLIEAANVPTSPASPNRPMVAAAGVGVGLAMAIGLFLLLELLNGAVRRPSDLQKSLGIVPLVNIPYIESRGRRLARRSGQVFAMLVVIIGVPAALWAVDTYYLPLDLLAQRILDKIGLA